MLDYLSPLAEEKRIRVINQCQGTVWADELLLQRVLSNLLTNAIRYSDENAMIRIESVHKNNIAEIRVANPGSPPPIQTSSSGVFGEEIMPATPPVLAWGYRWLTRLPYCTVARRLTAMPMNITSFRFIYLIAVIAKVSTVSIPLPCDKTVVINTTLIKRK